MYVRSSVLLIAALPHSVPLQELERAAQPLYRDQGTGHRDQQKQRYQEAAKMRLPLPLPLVADPCALIPVFFLSSHKAPKSHKTQRLKLPIWYAQSALIDIEVQSESNCGGSSLERSGKSFRKSILYVNLLE
jgi:hypothetical protein